MPNGITPRYVKNLEELDTLLNKIDKKMSRDIVLYFQSYAEKPIITVDDNMPILKSTRPHKHYNKNTTNFNLNDIGGKIV